ncbi:MAG: hypothetical protein JO173_11610 [Gammaproteobacteria bacterium]|nr:hypothetical protein [Gammaproteobacteria bacterium]
MTAGSLRLRRGRALLFAGMMPALLLRALIPFGFMPVATSEGLKIALCPGIAGLPSAGAHGHPHHDTRAPGGSEGGAHHAPCLFSASGSVAGAPATLMLTLTGSAPRAEDSAQHPRLFSPSILRAQSPRAPPSPA